ncbi:hypothetical protein QVD17_34558 [Tagetes erecta]|uniref:RNase H type-1 domain-containing protein n=1 Tax=Tagetes erecta TaxID=13708 RepID=A0AAD8NLA1_TARER|nr:hypothetical protein QVD17_34558 [Tagetes erecta]
MNPVVVQWNPPNPGWIKLNTDGSSRGNPGQSSYGGIIRNNHGGLICGYMGRLGYCVSLASEIWGIMRGLRLIKEQNLNNVIIETDCQAAIMLITVRKVDDSDPLSSLINACRKDMMDLRCYMVHVKREGNRCADLLAKIGGYLDQGEYIFHRDPPLELISPLIDDAYRRN